MGKELAVMEQQLAVLHDFCAASVDGRVIINVFNIVHKLKLLAIRTGNQHLIAVINQRFYQLLAEAIDVIVIVCQQRNKLFTHLNPTLNVFLNNLFETFNNIINILVAQ